MKDLIEAFNIFLKYGNPDYPTHCEHDCLYVCDIDPEKVSAEDIKKLDDLGFMPDDDGGFMSFKFGSA